MAKKNNNRRYTNKNKVNSKITNGNDKSKRKYVDAVDSLNADFNKISDDLDLTNVSELTFDEIRLADVDSLDTSFLEGRKSKKKNEQRIINSYDKKNDEKKESKKINHTKKRRGNFFITFVGFIIVFILGFVLCFAIDFNRIVNPKINIVEKTKIVVDDNYLFLGDSITDFYDLDKYYKDLPVVNSGISGDTTESILSDMEKRVYQYNPSKVFLLIGTNDHSQDKSNEEISDNIEKIIKEIKENRPYCKIYLEAIYPVNDTDDDKIDHDMVHDRNNEDIRAINERLKEIAKEQKITYIDMYSLLADDDNNLKLDYTKEGLHISDEGYEKITKEIMKYIEE